MSAGSFYAEDCPSTAGDFMRSASFILLLILIFGIPAAGAATPASSGNVQIEIQSPSFDATLSEGETMIEVEGIASAIGGVRYLDMMFVMDTSQSLRGTDPDDYRSAGAIGLVKSLSPKSDIKIGVVSFSGNGELAQPMTSDRDSVVTALRDLPRSGSTNLAAGIRTALRELQTSGRPGSSRVIMLFTDGKSNEKKAYEAAVLAHSKGVAVQTMLLGDSKKGSSILDTIAWATGGSFVQVTDPAKLPQAFLDLRTTGIDSVTLSVNDSLPEEAQLAGGTFAGSVPLQVCENRIVASATSLEGETQEAVVTVMVRDASCAALEVAAVKEGRPVISLNDRAVEIVVDASRSMWGRMGGEPKMSVAKDILQDVSYWFPEDLDLALRAYGSTSPSDDNDCADSTLLVPFGEQNRYMIRQAIDNLRPLGQTPIAYALNEAARDFSPGQEDRALVLVTDGIESCGGDPVYAARQLREQNITVHLIGFGLGNAKDEDTASLQAVAYASGGRYVTAGSAEELKDALEETVATPFTVFSGNTRVANGSLGSEETLFLPEGDYRVELHSSPPQVMPISLAPRDRLTLTLEKRAGLVSHHERRGQLPHMSCEEAVASMERRIERENQRRSAATVTD